MGRIFITGSSGGLGRMAAQLLTEQGHEVVLHARTLARACDAQGAVPGASRVVVGNLSSIAQTRHVAEQANALGPFDAVIHNAAVGPRERQRVETEDGLSHMFAVNTLAPYILTALIRRPHRLVYVGCGLHRRGNAGLRDLAWRDRPWRGDQAYSDTKLHGVLLALAVARRWPATRSDAVEPGWAAAGTGGPQAAGDSDAACRTQAWLAVGGDPAAAATGGYFPHWRPCEPDGAARDVGLQDRLLAECGRLSGVEMPTG